MKKIGLICLALVLALGVLGVGFAHWSQEVVIEQEVTTGEVLVGVFGWQVHYEDKDACNVTVTHGEYKFSKLIDPFPPGAIIPGVGVYPYYESAKITIDNLYPSLWIVEDFFIANAGTIPVKLQVTLNVTDPDGVYKHLDLRWKKYVFSDGVWTLHAEGMGKADVELPKLVAALEGEQLEPCETIFLWFDKHLQQEAPQGKTASLELKVNGIQWNMYGTPT